MAGHEQQGRLDQLLKRLGVSGGSCAPAALDSCERQPAPVKGDINWLEDLADVERTFQLIDAEEGRRQAGSGTRLNFL